MSCEQQRYFKPKRETPWAREQDLSGGGEGWRKKLREPGGAGEKTERSCRLNVGKNTPVISRQSVHE